MPKLMLDSNMDDGLAAGSGGNSFRFSAVRPDNLGATEYTLVTIAVDDSGSVGAFKKELEDCLKAAVEACQRSPRAENLLVRVVEFASNQITEIHGFKLLNQINLADYSITLPHGGTPLCDATYNSLGSIQAYGKTLFDQEFNVNAICFVITDGEENTSTATAHTVKTLKEEIIRAEEIESVLTILVGININDRSCKMALERFEKDAAFDQFICAADASKGTLAKLAQFVSKSISSQSQSLGTGGPSQTLTF